MSNTFTNLLYHVVFSTKHRHATLKDGFRLDLDSYIGGIIKNRDGIPIEIGGTEDHIHILAKLSPTRAIEADKKQSRIVPFIPPHRAVDRPSGPSGA
jgi:REP element-mobilizing transposase RayT